MMQRLTELGIRRVTWAYYGDGHGGYAIPTACRDDNWKNLELTCRQLGNPLKVAVAAGHRHGLEVYAYFKPYETGPAVVIPEGSPEARRTADSTAGRFPGMGRPLRDPSSRPPHSTPRRRGDRTMPPGHRCGRSA